MMIKTAQNSISIIIANKSDGLCDLHELSSSPSMISLLQTSSSTLLNASPLTRGPLGREFLGVGDIEALYKIIIYSQSYEIYDR